MSPRWRWFLLGYLLALPHTLVGLLLALVYRSREWRWSDGCLECIAGSKDRRTRIWGQPWAQTHGFLIIYDCEAHRETPWLRVHERVHVFQGFVGSVFFPIAYGVCFTAHFVWTGCKNWWRSYEAIPFERAARARADDIVSRKVRGTLEGRWGAGQ